MVRAPGEGLAASGARRARVGLLRGVVGDRGVLGRVVTTSVVATGCLNRKGSMRARPERLGSMPICEVRIAVGRGRSEQGERGGAPAKRGRLRQFTEVEKCD
jgi:hypothetical protein